MHGSVRGTQAATRAILNSLFPSWLPRAFAAMFARPLPDLSCRLNAWATWLTCQWLMGECEVNDVELDGGRMGAGHGVLVKRCGAGWQAGSPALRFGVRHAAHVCSVACCLRDGALQLARGIRAGRRSGCCRWLMMQYPWAPVLHRSCRYLEESGCASICINSCKVPTQASVA